MSHALIRILKKKQRIIIGVLSGTSMDGLDIGVYRIGKGISEEGFKTYPFTKSQRTTILKGTSPLTTLPEICYLNTFIGNLIAKAILRFMQKFPISKKSDAIASHGQTVWHIPPKGKQHGSTLQLGEPSIIASQTKKIVCSDFRTGEMALGGHGAPLVPYFEKTYFQSKKKTRLMINIGGISNITVLPEKKHLDKKIRILSFDCGPGNILLDKAMQYFFDHPFDKNGSLAYQGTANMSLVELWLKHPFLKIPPAKSTGRELFSDSYFQEEIIKKSNLYKLSPKDTLATLVEFTVACIYSQYQKFSSIKAQEVIVSGGGTHNQHLMQRLKETFHPLSVIPINNISSLSEDSKESALFAWLGNEFLNGRSASMTTPAILGKLSLPPQENKVSRANHRDKRRKD